jgi:phenylpyruvate tautomerase PptA (4-oxalocrotonate tautomerase family)
MLLNLYILAQEYLISFSLHLNAFKSFKCYIVRYRNITNFNNIIHSIEIVNCDNKITIVSIYELGKNSWYWWDIFTNEKSWKWHIFNCDNKITLVNIYELGKNSWYWRNIFTSEKSWKWHIFKWEKNIEERISLSVKVLVWIYQVDIVLYNLDK